MLVPLTNYAIISVLAAPIEFGLLSWCERHGRTWREQGHDEMWIRQRIEMAQISRGLHRNLKEQGLTMLQTRERLRDAYADYAVPRTGMTRTVSTVAAYARSARAFCNWLIQQK